MFGIIHHFAGVIMIPVLIEDPVLFEQVAVRLGMWERRQYSEFCKVQIDLEQEVDQPLDICLLYTSPSPRD